MRQCQPVTFFTCVFTWLHYHKGSNDIWVCFHASITWSLRALFYYLLDTNTEESTYKTCHKIFIVSIFFFVVLIYRCWGRRKPATVRTLLRKPTLAGWWTPENTGRVLHPSGPTARKDSVLHGCKDAALFKLLTGGEEHKLVTSFFHCQLWLFFLTLWTFNHFSVSIHKQNEKLKCFTKSQMVPVTDLLFLFFALNRVMWSAAETIWYVRSPS